MKEFSVGIPGSAKQLRGKALEKFLVTQLNRWWMSCLESGLPFAYSQAQFSKKVGVSRETIRKKQEILDVVLAERSAPRRVLNCRENRPKDLADVERLRRELSALNDKYRCLQAMHVKIFSIMLERGVDPESFGFGSFEGCNDFYLS